MKNTETIIVRVTPKLKKTLKSVGNMSEFIKKAILEKLEAIKKT